MSVDIDCEETLRMVKAFQAVHDSDVRRILLAIAEAAARGADVHVQRFSSSAEPELLN